MEEEGEEEEEEEARGYANCPPSPFFHLSPTEDVLTLTSRDIIETRALSLSPTQRQVTYLTT